MNGTLVLNASHEPLCVISCVEPCCDDLLHSEHVTLEALSVVRLNRYVRVPRRTRVPITRRGVIARDRERREYCAGRADTIDDVIPRSRSGPHAGESVVAACARCNHSKADHLLSEIGWTLSFKPARPSAPLAGVSSHQGLSADWEPYALGWPGREEAVA